MAELGIPKLRLLLLAGASGSGKSTLAGAHILPFEVLSGGFLRGLVSNDENDQSATKAALESVSFVAGRRLDAGLLAVLDATSVRPDARRELVRLARDHDVEPVAVMVDVPEEVYLRRDELGTTAIRAPGLSAASMTPAAAVVGDPETGRLSHRPCPAPRVGNRCGRLPARSLAEWLHRGWRHL